MHFDLQPVLENDIILLTPLKEEDFEALYQIASDPLIWEQHPVKTRSEKDGFVIFFKESMASGGALLIVDKDTDEAIGSSRYKLFETNPNIVEIGWSFLGKKYWGGYYNGLFKQLMLVHAFKYVDSVIFIIDEHNIRSQKAVMKIGGQKVQYPETELNIEPSSPSKWIFIIHKKDWKRIG